MLTNNTHDYDRKIGAFYTELLLIDNAELVEPDSPDNTIAQINKTILEKPPVDTIKHQFLFFWNFLCRGVYDPINQMHSIELLCRLWRFVKYYDETGLQVFYEQIADLASGSCAQGVITRIFQFYAAHMTSKDEIYTKNMKIKPVEPPVIANS